MCRLFCATAKCIAICTRFDSDWNDTAKSAKNAAIMANGILTSDTTAYCFTGSAKHSKIV
jgi:hypothetical protein